MLAVCRNKVGHSTNRPHARGATAEVISDSCEIKWGITCWVQDSVILCVIRGRVQSERDGTRWRTGGEVKGKLANGVGMQYPSHYLGTVYPALLPLMRTPLLPVVDWTNAPADLSGLVRLAERRNLVSARVPSHFKRILHKFAVGQREREREREASHPLTHSSLQLWCSGFRPIGMTHSMPLFLPSATGSDESWWVHLAAKTAPAPAPPPPTAQITVTTVKPCLSLRGFSCFQAVWNETVFPLLEVFYTAKSCFVTSYTPSSLNLIFGVFNKICWQMKIADTSREDQRIFM